MKPITALLPLLVASVLSTAALAQEAPRVSNMASHAQGRSASVQHWQVMSDDIAAQVIDRLGREPLYYVQPFEGGTVFEAGLSDFLATSLYKAGARVAATPTEGVTVIALKTFTASHPSSADTQLPMKATLLTAGLMVLREIALESWQAGLLSLAIGTDIAHQVSHDTPRPRTEVAVTTSVQRAGEYAWRKTDVYYVDDQDAALYGTSAWTLRVRGD